MSEYCLSLSYGKDSMACLGAIEELGLPLDRIITADVWATDTIPADLPPMQEFKAYADKVIKDRWGIDVEHFCAINKNGSKETYDSVFHTVVKKQKVGSSKGAGHIYGFPLIKGAWCNSKLKIAAINQSIKSACINSTHYIGIASDEPTRIARHKDKPNIVLPLVEVGWDEAYCRQWCEENGLLSPIYQDSSRGGCWFCHNQGVDSLRRLRQAYPEYWSLLLKWDSDSPITFRADGHTVHDYDRRFQWEDDGYLPTGKKFRWDDIENAQMNIHQFLEEEAENDTRRSKA